MILKRPDGLWITVRTVDAADEDSVETGGDEFHVRPGADFERAIVRRALRYMQEQRAADYHLRRECAVSDRLSELRKRRSRRLVEIGPEVKWSAIDWMHIKELR